jgi:SAM-dependent methyltransferase
LIVMPHALEFCAEPHAALREAERVLVPEGRLVLTGFNPASLWGLRQARQRLLRRFGLGELFLPERGDFIAYHRLRDWLRLLSFEVTASQFGVYSPAMRSEGGLARMAWMEGLGGRFWPVFGAVYMVVAVKRVRGMRLMTPPLRKPVFTSAPVSVANKYHQSWTNEQK